MTGDTDMHLLVTDTLTEKVGPWIIKPVSIWCDHHLPHAAQHISFTYIHIYQTVDCDHWNVVPPVVPLAVRSCWILVGTGTHCRTHRSRASQICSTGDMCGEYAGH